jgi:hypothetical protein
MTINLSLSTVLACTTDINLCCFLAVENNENHYTDSCCIEAEITSDCCVTETPPPPKKCIFSELIDKESYRNNICDLKEYVSDGIILKELYGIACEERLIPKDFIYYYFRPPKA